MTQPKPAPRTQQRFSTVLEHPETAATATWSLWVADRACMIDAVKYNSPTGLALDAGNCYAGVAKKNATTFATLFDTGVAALTAGTWYAGTLDADSTKRTLDVDDEVKLTATKTGTQTLPPGKLGLYVRYIA